MGKRQAFVHRGCIYVHSKITIKMFKVASEVNSVEKVVFRPAAVT